MNNQRTLAPSKRKGQFAYKVTVTAAQATTPKFTFAAGAPAALVNWGDGTALEAVTSGTELTHAYTNAGTYTVKLLAAKQQKYLTQIDISSDKVSYVLTPIQLFPKLTQFRGQTNAIWSQDIGSWILPPLLQYAYINATGVTGSLNSWVLPAGLLYLIISDTALTGCPIMTSMVSIAGIYASNCTLIQATVDLYLSRCVAREVATTYATPELLLGGTGATKDSAPSDPAGLADAATLTAAGWAVTVTP